MTNEEIIKQLESIASAELVVDGLKVGAITKEAFEAIQETARLAIAALESDRWISVEERLPEKSGRYLVAEKRDLVYADLECHDYETQVRRYFTDYGWRYPVVLTDGIREAEQRLITHWRPLPEPPKEDKP